MLKARPYDDAKDRLALLDAHTRQSIKLTGAVEGLTFCDPDDSEQILTVVVEDDAGTPVAFAHGRLIVTAGLTLDPDYGTPRERLDACLKASAGLLARLAHMGVKKVITTSAAGDRFADRLEKDFGFKRTTLPVLSFDLSRIRARGKENQ